MDYENVWDEGAFGTRCGYFIPIQTNLDGFIDDQGNSIKEKATEYEKEMRDLVAQIHCVNHFQL